MYTGHLQLSHEKSKTQEAWGCKAKCILCISNKVSYYIVLVILYPTIHKCTVIVQMHDCTKGNDIGLTSDMYDEGTKVAKLKRDCN